MINKTYKLYNTSLFRMATRKERLALCFNIIGKEFKSCMSELEEAPRNFSIKDMAVIQLLGEQPMMMSELAVQLNLTPGTMTTKVDNLIKKKFVERAFDSEDRRKVYIQLTLKGENIYKSILEQTLMISGNLLKKLDSTEQEEYVRLTEKLII